MRRRLRDALPKAHVALHHARHDLRSRLRKLSRRRHVPPAQRRRCWPIRLCPKPRPSPATSRAAGSRGCCASIGMPVEGMVPADSVEELPEAPDLAVLCLPPARLEAAMAALAARGCHAAVVPGAAPDLAAISARTGVKALGQGSFGLCVPAIGLNASLAHIAPAPGQAGPGDPIRGAGPRRAGLGGGRGGRLQPCHRHRRQCHDRLRHGARLAGAGRRDRRGAARPAADPQPPRLRLRRPGRGPHPAGGRHPRRRPQRRRLRHRRCIMEAALRRAGVLRV